MSKRKATSAANCKRPSKIIAVEPRPARPNQINALTSAGQSATKRTSPQAKHSVESQKRRRKGEATTSGKVQAPANTRGKQPTKRVTLMPNPPRTSRPLPTLPASVLNIINANKPVAPTKSLAARKVATGAATATSIATPPTPASIVRQEAAATRLQRLHETATLLQALHARNKNQHRGQAWWRWFSMLRRRVVELLGVEVRLWEVWYGDATGASAVAVGRGYEAPAGEAEKMRLRLALERELKGKKAEVERWLREVVVPKAWAAFMGLVGDGQFAGLGLVLVGVVADVMGFVGGCEEGEAEGVAAGMSVAGDVAMKEVDVGYQDEGATAVGNARRGAGPGRETTMEDIGEVVQRRPAIKQPLPRDTTLSASTTSEEREIKDEDMSMLDYGTDGPDHTPSSPFADFDSFESEDVEEQVQEPTRPPMEFTSSHDQRSTKSSDGVVPELLREQRHLTSSLPLEAASAKRTSSRAKESVKELLVEDGKGSIGDKKRKEKKKKKGNAIDDLFAGFA